MPADPAAVAAAEKPAPPLYGPFVPAGSVAGRRGGGYCRSNRQDLPGIVSELKATLMRDWEDCEVDVYADEDEFVVVEFGLRTVGSARGLLAYMTSACNQDRTISSYGLRKVADLWHHCPGNGNAYFVFRPHWVAATATPGKGTPRAGTGEAGVGAAAAASGTASTAGAGAGRSFGSTGGGAGAGGAVAS